MSAGVFCWDARAEKLLRVLNKQRFSSAQIARRLSRECGVEVSRNAVIGKAHRLGLDFRGARRRRSAGWSSARLAQLAAAYNRGESIAALARRFDVNPCTIRRYLQRLDAAGDLTPPLAQRRAAQSRRRKRIPPGAGDDPARGVTLMALAAEDCRWCTGEIDGQHRFCGHPVALGRPYCPAHAARAFVPVKRRAG